MKLTYFVLAYAKPGRERNRTRCFETLAAERGGARVVVWVNPHGRDARLVATEAEAYGFDAWPAESNNVKEGVLRQALPLLGDGFLVWIEDDTWFRPGAGKQITAAVSAGARYLGAGGAGSEGGHPPDFWKWVEKLGRSAGWWTGREPYRTRGDVPASLYAPGAFWGADMSVLRGMNWPPEGSGWWDDLILGEAMWQQSITLATPPLNVMVNDGPRTNWRKEVKRFPWE